jgi:hypothetical protein
MQLTKPTAGLAFQDELGCPPGMQERVVLEDPILTGEPKAR